MAQPDIVVIGGGLIGVLTAAELTERGARVTVLEKDDLGFEQSARSVAAVNLPAERSATTPDLTNGETSSMLRVSADEWSSFESRQGERTVGRCALPRTF